MLSRSAACCVSGSGPSLRVGNRWWTFWESGQKQVHFLVMCSTKLSLFANAIYDSTLRSQWSKKLDPTFYGFWRGWVGLPRKQRRILSRVSVGGPLLKAYLVLPMKQIKQNFSNFYDVFHSIESRELDRHASLAKFNVSQLLCLSLRSVSVLSKTTKRIV